jgi:hypothetical protein
MISGQISGEDGRPRLQIVLPADDTHGSVDGLLLKRRYSRAMTCENSNGLEGI